MSDDSITNNKSEQNVEKSSENREQGAATDKFQSEAQSALSSRDFTNRKDNTAAGALPKLELGEAKDFGGKGEDPKGFGGKGDDAKGFGSKGEDAKGEKIDKEAAEKDGKGDKLDKENPLGKDEMDKEDPLGKGEMDKEDPLGKDEMDKEDPLGKEEMDKEDPLGKDEMDKEDPLGKDEMDKEDPLDKDEKGDYFDEKLDKWVDIEKDKDGFDKKDEKDFDKNEKFDDKFDKVDPTKKAEIMDKLDAQSNGKPYYDKHLDKWVNPSKGQSQGANYNQFERPTGITRASRGPNANGQSQGPHGSDYAAGFTGPRKRHGGR